jgi:hypothetical protein
MSQINNSFNTNRRNELTGDFVTGVFEPSSPENPYFIEVDYFQKYKDRQKVGGDTFLSRKIREEDRTITVLSDGLGSGIKANVLSTLTASMAIKYITNLRDIKKSSEIIMSTLPVCKVRKISYSTFTIADIDEEGNTKIIEYDNPPFILLRGNRAVQVEKSIIKGRVGNNREYELHYSNFQIRQGDRLILYTDGITQSGIGTEQFPLGWGDENIADFAVGIVKDFPEINARDLCKRLVNKAYQYNRYRALDDITCCVIYYRKPRELLLVSGPPSEKEKDIQMARAVENFNGKKVICGGTTANIIARLLDRELELDIDIDDLEPDIPPTSTMKGINLVTEGIITLSKVAQLLEDDTPREHVARTPAKSVAEALLHSDIIHVLAGTTINKAHQDPNVPVELEIRRNIIKRILKILENKYLKETHLKFI